MGGKELLDGGYSAAFPLEWAEQNGYGKKIVILTQPIDTRKQAVSAKKRSTFRTCYSSYPAFLDTVDKVPAMYNRQREKLAAMTDRGEAFVIAPREEMTIGKMESNSKKLYLYYLHGRRDALNALPALKEYLEK
jgi:predicted patatin/cPLA2 family phospholipase